MLSSYIDDGNIPTDCVKENQVFALIQGLAGSGKSYVINAWSAVAKSWGRESAVLCVAITGIAASSLGGRTIASVLCMRKYRYLNRRDGKNIKFRNLGRSIF